MVAMLVLVSGPVAVVLIVVVANVVFLLQYQAIANRSATGRQDSRLA